MAELSDSVPIEQALKDYREILGWVEPLFPRYRSIIESLPAEDPEARLTRAWLKRWEAFRQAIDQSADIDYEALFKEIKELNDSLPGLSSTRPPFSGLIDVPALRDYFLSLGHTDEQAKLLADEACKSENHRPCNDRVTAIEALRMRLARPRKSYTDIANALCREHGNSPRQHRRSYNHAAQEMRLDACSEKYRGQIRKLQEVLEKYTIADPHQAPQT